MTKLFTFTRHRHANALALASALLMLGGCERSVTVQSVDPISMSPVPPFGPSGAGGFGAGYGGVGGTSDEPTAGAAGFGMATGGSGMIDEPGGSTAPQAGTGGTAPAPSGLLAAVEQAQPGASALLQDFIVLNDTLSSIERPAAGSDGTSLVQFRSSGSASIQHVGWNRSSEQWYGSSGAFYAYTASYLEQHLSLLHAETYGIYANGSGDELSGTAATYKEFLAASSEGFAWIDYPDAAGASAVPFAPMTYGEIVLQSWSGARRVLSDKLRYRAHLALSATHAAFVEYASVEPGSFGQIVVQDLAGGVPFAVAPSSLHQDRPAIDGDWVVFEEYLGGEDAVIRGYNLATGELRTLSESAGFRTNADVLGTRVVWEDQRSGNGDVHMIDLAGGSEQAIISGRGHSATPRLISDGLLWIEAQNNRIGLVRARWR